MKHLVLAAGLALASALGAAFRAGEASDHDDGDTDLKSRALDLTDHFAFTSPSNPAELSLVMHVSPRSLPGKAYFLSPGARYEFHVGKAASRTSTPTAQADFVFRFEAGEPGAGDVQAITLTVFRNGVQVGTHAGSSTSYAASKTDDITQNDALIDDASIKYFVGMRADAFYFDVNRFFQVRAFLASRFFGGGTGRGNADASLAPNCEGDAFLQGVLGTPELDGDDVNLFDPPSCAPDFTKNHNVIAIVMDVPIAMLGGGPVFDTWSTISVKR